MPNDTSPYRYFAYGSNLCSSRLRERTPSASVVAVARLAGYDLRFHKRSTDTSGKCDAYETRKDTDVVWGVVFEIDSQEKPALDRAEALNAGYEERPVDLESDAGSISALTYVASPGYVDDGLVPFAWYLRYVVLGAEGHEFSDHYVRRLREVQTRIDPNEDRRLHHERRQSLGCG